MIALLIIVGLICLFLMAISPLTLVPAAVYLVFIGAACIHYLVPAMPFWLVFGTASVIAGVVWREDRKNQA